MLVLRLRSSAVVSAAEVRSVVLVVVVVVCVSVAQAAMLRTTAAIKLFARDFISAF
jgi:hypothetical protein